MTLEQRISALVTAIGGDIKILLAAKGDLSALTTTAKTSLVDAINELDAAIDGLAASSGAVIDDAAGDAATTVTWSANKIYDELQALKNSILGGVGTAYDTLQELATELTDQDSVVSGLVASVANRVRFDAAQGLTSPQQLQARQNIGAQSAAEIGNPDADLVAAYTTAKA